MAERKQVTLAEALDWGRDRVIDREKSSRDYTEFTDGSAVELDHKDGFAYSTMTWESGETLIWIHLPPRTSNG